MRLLISAFSCCPGLGSEPGIGWHAVEELAREHEVWVMVDRNAQPAVRRAVAGLELPNIHWQFVGIPVLSPLVAGPLNNGPAWLLYYYLWQIVMAWQARRLHQRVRFEACQHVTFGKYNVPSFLHLLGLPFIWGPVGGAEKAPACFYAEFDWKTRLGEAARVAHQHLAAFDPWVRWCHRRSTHAVAVTEESAQAMRALGARHVEVLPAVALSADEISAVIAACAAREESDEDRPLTLFYVGRLLPWKGVHLGLRALAASANKQLRYRIAGDGPLRAFLEAEASRLGLADRVEFTGNLPREAVLQAYGQADGFLYPSLHDSGGNAVIEAMAAAVPVLCLRYGGPDLLVDEACGWKVSAGDPATAVTVLARALDEFAGSREERLRRGAAARAYCLAHHTWERHGVVLRGMHEGQLAAIPPA